MELNNPDRFWSKVNKTDTCWLWIAGTDKDGYGLFKISNKMFKAHRLSWEIKFGAIKDNLWVLHKCDNPPCVNPKHLFLGTHQDNTDDKLLKNRQPRGENMPWSKLKEQDVLNIKDLLITGIHKNILAKQFNVSVCTINDIIAHRSWKYLNG